MDRNKKIDFAHTVLGVIGAAGLISVAVLAPNVLQIFKPLLNDGRHTSQYPQTYINRALRRLRAQGLIELVRGGGFYQLTPGGEELLSRYRLRHVTIPKPKKWDKRWRLVVFDVREKIKYLRDYARETLEQLGFVRLQDSVWIYPYECAEVIELMRTSYRLRKDILYIPCDRFPQDAWLVTRFVL